MFGVSLHHEQRPREFDFVRNCTHHLADCLTDDAEFLVSDATSLGLPDILLAVLEGVEEILSFTLEQPEGCNDERHFAMPHPQGSIVRHALGIVDRLDEVVCAVCNGLEFVGEVPDGVI